jgi:hypothetical protein
MSFINQHQESLEELQQLLTQLRFLNSEEAKAIFALMEQDTFDDIDCLNMSEEEEKLLHVLYQLSSFICSQNFFTESFQKPFQNVKNQLEPLFIDTTEYLNREPNKSILLRSLKQYEEGNFREIDL